PVRLGAAAFRDRRARALWRRHAGARGLRPGRAVLSRGAVPRDAAAELLEPAAGCDRRGDGAPRRVPRQKAPRSAGEPCPAAARARMARAGSGAPPVLRALERQSVGARPVRTLVWAPLRGIARLVTA